MILHAMAGEVKMIKDFSENTHGVLQASIALFDFSLLAHHR